MRRSGFEQLKPILDLGDRHTTLEHQIKILWLINKLARENDTVILERPYTPVNPTVDGPNGRYYSFKDNLRFRGWDSPEARKSHQHFILRSLDTIKYFESCSSLNKCPGEARMKKDIANLEVEFSGEEFKRIIGQLLAKIDPCEKTIISELEKIGDDFLFILKRYQFICKQVQELSGEKLKFLYLCFIQLYILLTIKKERVEWIYLNLFDRDPSLAKTIMEEVGDGKKIWVQAGKNHVRNSKKLKFWRPRSDLILRNKIQNRKFIILCPTKSKDNISHVEAFLEKWRSNLIKIILSDKFINDFIADKYVRLFTASTVGFFISHVIGRLGDFHIGIGLKLLCLGGMLFNFMKFPGILGNLISPFGYKHLQELDSRGMELMKKIDIELGKFPKELYNEYETIFNALPEDEPTPPDFCHLVRFYDLVKFAI